MFLDMFVLGHNEQLEKGERAYAARSSKTGRLKKLSLNVFEWDNFNGLHANRNTYETELF